LNLDENTVVHVKKGMEVELVVGAIPDTVFTGTVQWVNPSADDRSHTFEVRIVVPNRHDRLRAGYFAQAAVIVDSKKDVLAVPVNALVGKRVFTIENDSIAIACEVEVGWITGQWAEIVSGLAENATVIVAGNKALPDSSIVVVTKPAADEQS
jgi:membrane fusion protein (multidrug efflux system)